MLNIVLLRGQKRNDVSGKMRKVIIAMLILFVPMPRKPFRNVKALFYFVTDEDNICF